MLGKATASHNATRHGLLSNAPVLEYLEDPAEWEQHRLGTLESLQPEGHLETVLATRIAGLLWRLNRVVNYETETLNQGLYYARKQTDDVIQLGSEHGADDPDERLRLAILRDHIVPKIIPTEETARIIMRYEAHYHRQWLQTLHELEAMQIRRRGGTSTLARLDITSGSE